MRTVSPISVHSYKQHAFTIVELLIVIVVIAILAAISIVGYNGIQSRARETAIASKESQVRKKLEVYKADEGQGQYPTSQSAFDSLIKQSSGDDFYTTYSSTSPYTTYTISTSGGSSGGGSSTANYMQTITASNCPSSRTMAVDARDNRTYWVQKLTDGRCWMLTNLAYAGAGTNTYGDARTITLSSFHSYTDAYYYVPPGANPTTNPTQPSTSTDGTGQYGYLYNFCGANGGQTGNGACSDSSAAAVNTSISVCPKNWRLPIGGNSGEFVALNNAVNSGAAYNDSGLRSGWLAQYGGYWSYYFDSQETYGYYWSSTQNSALHAYFMNFRSTYLDPTGYTGKRNGYAVRCVAS